MREKENWERNEAAATRHGIERSGNHGGAKEQDGLIKVQTFVYQKNVGQAIRVCTWNVLGFNEAAGLLIPATRAIWVLVSLGATKA